MNATEAIHPRADRSSEWGKRSYSMAQRATREPAVEVAGETFRLRGHAAQDLRRSIRRSVAE